MLKNSLLHAAFIQNFGNAVDTSKPESKKVFYALCQKFVVSRLNLSTTTFGVATIFDAIINTERVLFNSSKVLDFIINLLAHFSDNGDTVHSQINLRLLDYFLRTYK